MANDKPTLLQRLNAIQSEVSYIQKERKPGMRYSIVSHDAVTASVRPLMVKHGVLYYPHQLRMEQVGNRTQVQMAVRFINVDDNGDFIDVETAGYGIDDQDKGPGKAISYSVKYALLKALGLETGDDPDEHQDANFRPVQYPDPPRRPSGQPEKGWREDGSKTAQSLKQSRDWEEFHGELIQVTNIPELNKFAFTWSGISEERRWTHEWRIQAKDEINKYKDALINSKKAKPEKDSDGDEIFPGDR